MVRGSVWIEATRPNSVRVRVWTHAQGSRLPLLLGCCDPHTNPNKLMLLNGLGHVLGATGLDQSELGFGGQGKWVP